MRSISRISDCNVDKKTQFKELSRAFCEALARAEINLRPFVDPGLPHFMKLSEELQAIVLASLDETLCIWEDAEGAGDSMSDSKQLLWRALTRMNWVPKSDLFEKIPDGSVVEIYTSEFRQIYRSPSFFKYVSCTLEELVSFPAYQLAEIPSEPMRYLMDLSQRLGRGEVLEAFTPDLAPYVIQELLGEDRMQVEVAITHCSPILEHGRSIALIVVHNSRVLGRG